VFSPYGMDGGSPGTLGEIILNPGTPTERKLHSKELVAIEYGDVVSFRCSGSGGVGPPRERARERVRRDLREGLITPDVAENVYELEERD
jgi:N-methylhydantoinase B